jgi:hypothetical protein
VRSDFAPKGILFREKKNHYGQGAICGCCFLILWEGKKQHTMMSLSVLFF